MLQLGLIREPIYQHAFAVNAESVFKNAMPALFAIIVNTGEEFGVKSIAHQFSDVFYPDAFIGYLKPGKKIFLLRYGIWLQVQLNGKHISS